MESPGFRIRRAIRKLRWELIRGGPGRTPRILTVPTANGLLSFSNMDLMIAKALYVQRAWELDLMGRTIDYLRREGHLEESARDLLIDAGANIGMICIAMVQRGAFRGAIAIEPGPENFALLERNIAQNGMTRSIRALQCALSNSPGEVEMELSDINFGDHRVRAVQATTPGRMEEEMRTTVRVPARTVDDIVWGEPRIDPARIGLIWVDVQGHEAQLFQGARKTLAHGAPVLTEFWPYGIARSGLDRNGYLEVVRTLFGRMVLVDAPADRFEPLDMAALARLFETHTSPDQFLELLLFPR